MKSTDWEIILSDYAERGRIWTQELDVEFPLYMQSYREALRAVFRNIHYNQKKCSVHEKGCNGMQSFISGSDSACLDESNIFAFIGGRGTGKTTAINEFCRILQKYNQNWEKWNQELGFNMQGRWGEEYRFHVMEPIDASVLETKEDLLEVILASMYGIFQKKVQYGRDTSGTGVLLNNRMQALGSRFDEVYKAYINMGSHRDQNILGESSLAKLMNASSSLKVRAAIQKLIKEFLALLDGGEKDFSYLVIAIDDLDLNLENGYNMLEQLQKYMADRKVIILAAIRYEQLQMICEKHIVDSLVPEYGAVHNDIFDRFAVEAGYISNDYLLKALPLTNRIYMPERKLIEKKGIITSKNGDGKKETVKQFVLKEVVLHTNIYYDIMGVKKHFCLPNTVRELVAYKDFLDALSLMEEIESEEVIGQKKRLFLYDQNHERFNSDIEERMTVQILDYGQRKLFQQIRERNIGRRAKYAINFLDSWIKNKKRQENGQESRQKLYLNDYVDEQEYCFADLLQALYELGRTYYEDKPLVHCLLASFTSEMVREYYNYRFNDYRDDGSENNKEERPWTKSMKYLGEFLGKTFGGRWFSDVMPGIHMEGHASRQKTNMKVAYLPNAMLRPIQITWWKNREPGQANMVTAIINDLAGFIPYLECLSLCFSDFGNKAGRTASCRWEFKLISGETEAGLTLELRIKNSADNATFDIFGFIGKELTGWGEGECGIEKLQEALTEEMCKGFKDFLVNNFSSLKKTGKEDEIENHIENLKKCIEQKSIWFDEAKNPEDKSGRIVAFPFYQVDLSYNVMKRVRRSIKMNKSLENMGIYDYFMTVYGYIEEELKKEEEKYQELIDNAPAFHDNFVSSPYIKALKGLDKEIFEVIFGNMLRGLYAVNIVVDMEEQDLQE